MQACCAVLHYVLLGARVPNTPPHNPLHSRNFVHVKSTLYADGFLPLMLRLIKTTQNEQLRTWATKAFGETQGHNTFTQILIFKALQSWEER